MGVPWSVLVVGPQDHGQLGGTFLVAREVAKSTAAGDHPRVISPEAALAALTDQASASTTLIFTIEEGQLSAEYGRWARECLARGATIVENNVFNLPSRHRPVHDRYITGFNTEEGAERFVVRSGPARKRRYFACSSVVNPVPEGRAPVTDGSILTMLRIGRPDPVKWTDWEVRFARQLAVTQPHVEVVLTLIGVPTTVDFPDKELSNLTIHRRGNTSDISSEYAKHNLYLHYSAIGETFGNTLAEAMNAGLFVVCALEPSWDCAPLTFLDSTMSIVGTPLWLERHPSEVVDAIQKWRDSGISGEVELRAGLTGSRYLERLIEAADGVPQATPSWLAANRSLVRRVKEIKGIRWGWSGVAFEWLRGLRLRVGQGR